MDDDTKHYTIQIKGTAYRFKPMTPADIERITILSHMDPTGLKSFRLICSVLSELAGAEQWSELLDRWIAKEVTETELTVHVFKRLIERQGKDMAAADAE